MDFHLTRISKTLVICAAVILLMMTAKKSGPVGNEVFYRFNADTLRCSILLSNSYASNEKRNFAFNYELLRIFGDRNGITTRIYPPDESMQGWTALLKGKRQIVVFNSKDTLPEFIAGNIIISAPMEGNTVWAIKRSDARLLNAVNFQYTKFTTEEFFEQMKMRYFRSYSMNWLLKQEKISSLSPYDGIIKKYSRRIGMDWRLLSSVIYQESQFTISAASKKSAKGLMQIKESTAAKYGVTDIYDPDNNVRAGALHLQHLITKYQKQGVDSLNSIKFALAAYHGGEARLEELRQIAADSGHNNNDWEEMKKSFRKQNGTTSTYITEILERYDLYCRLID